MQTCAAHTFIKWSQVEWRYWPYTACPRTPFVLTVCNSTPLIFANKQCLTSRTLRSSRRLLIHKYTRYKWIGYGACECLDLLAVIVLTEYLQFIPDLCLAPTKHLHLRKDPPRIDPIFSHISLPILITFCLCRLHISGKRLSRFSRTMPTTET